MWCGMGCCMGWWRESGTGHMSRHGVVVVVMVMVILVVVGHGCCRGCCSCCRRVTSTTVGPVGRHEGISIVVKSWEKPGWDSSCDRRFDRRCLAGAAAVVSFQ
jgi:hypothetical protein